MFENALYMVVLLVLILTLNKRRIRNAIGRHDGYGSCPNCGDCWSWKTSGIIKCQRRRVLSSDGSGVSTPARRGVMICHECLSKPSSLCSRRVGKNLRASHWPEKDIRLAEKAVEWFRKDNKPFQPIVIEAAIES